MCTVLITVRKTPPATLRRRPRIVVDGLFRDGRVTVHARLNTRSHWTDETGIKHLT